MSFTCPKCGAVSHHPKDKEHGYCGRCRDFTAPPFGQVAGAFVDEAQIVSVFARIDERVAEQVANGNFERRTALAILHEVRGVCADVVTEATLDRMQPRATQEAFNATGGRAS